MPSITGHCPECDAEVSLEGVLQREIIVCADCGIDLEVVSLDPVMLDPAPVEQDDWGE
jgi:alpha-aminoadipate/glutamate carrier protein LysW